MSRRVSLDNIAPRAIDFRSAKLTYKGIWTEKIDPRIPLVGEPLKYMETRGHLASVSTNITDAVAVEIRGNRDLDHWTYNVVSPEFLSE